AQALLRSAQLKHNPETPQSAVSTDQESPAQDPAAEQEECQDLSPEPSPAPADTDHVPTLEESLILAASNAVPDVPLLRTKKRVWLRRAGIVVVMGLIAAGLPSLRSKSHPVQVPHISTTDGSAQSAVDVTKLTPAAPLVAAAPVEGRSLNQP